MFGAIFVSSAPIFLSSSIISSRVEVFSLLIPLVWLTSDMMILRFALCIERSATVSGMILMKP